MNSLTSASTVPASVKPAARRRARRLLLQALYQWKISKTPIKDLLQQFHEEASLKKVDVAYFDELLPAILKSIPELDEAFQSALDRTLKELDPISLSILRLSTYELSYRIDIPYVIVIHEGVELAKIFGATDSYKYINGVLDKIALSLRPAEYGSSKKDMRP